MLKRLLEGIFRFNHSIVMFSHIHIFLPRNQMYSSNGFCKNSCLNDKFLAPRPFQIKCGSVKAVLYAECPTKS